MDKKCNQCGAALLQAETCEDLFNLSQVYELENPAYYCVHHLSVPCYFLQHNRYSREGWLQAFVLLHRFVYTGYMPAEALKENKKSSDSVQRNFSFTRGTKLAGVEDIAWHYSIADVRLDSSEHYCADVLYWAKQVLKDADDLVKKYA